MFDVGLQTDNHGSPFARHLPVSNWYYPFELSNTRLPRGLSVLEDIDWSMTRRRAAYFHIPFCDTICTFCPFTRGRYSSDDAVEDYLRALVREVQLKRPYVGKLRVDSIFIGGGTPSILNAGQIAALGDCIHTYLDTSTTTECAAEVEVKSVTREKLLAFKQIGVTRISFGVQTFSPSFRRAFHLDAAISQIQRVAEWVNELFPYTNLDMIYGISGQDVEKVIADADAAIRLGTTTIDFYMLNNLSGQVKMHQELTRLGLQRLSAKQRVEQRRRLAQHMLERGFARINGYSYARKRNSPSELIQFEPNFLYHDILYGYHDDAVVGYGASALTRAPGFNFCNADRRETYSSWLLETGRLPMMAHDVGKAMEKGVVTFPYRGLLVKSRICWESVPQDTLEALSQLVRAGLVVEHPETFTLTEAGWLFYVNLMYFLMPGNARLWLSEEMSARISAGHDCEATELL